jgi:hypothetical protein
LISEIMYDPAAPSAAELAEGYQAADFEFVELHNRGATALDLNPLRFTKGIDFEFATLANAILQPGQTLIIAGNGDAFAMRYGFTADGAWGGDKLDNQGELLKLSFGAGLSVIEIDYDDMAPWPGDETSGSIELLDLATANQSAPQAWRRSTGTNGSPGSVPASGPGREEPVILGVELEQTTLRLLRLVVNAAPEARAPELQVSPDLVSWSPAASVITKTEDIPGARRFVLEIPIEKPGGTLYVRASL